MNIINKELTFGNLSTRSRTNRLILHYADAKECGAQLIHQWHRQNGWAGIGYHFVVRKDGSIEMGRPENAVGAHAVGSNSDSIGICFEGDYDVEQNMPAAQRQAGKELVAYLKSKYGISKVQRHKDVCATTCPGQYFPFGELSGASGNITVLEKEEAASYKNDIAQLQAECNRQGFSSQDVDGIPGPITLAGCPMLKKGASGNITRWVQTKLNSLGYNCGAVDGDFGSNTKNGIMAYQKAKGLTVDGIVGPKTWSKILGLS